MNLLSLAVAEEQRAIAEDYRAEAEARIQQRSDSTPAAPGPRLNFEVEIDREGNPSVDGEKIDLDELKAKLVKLKDDTSNAFSLRRRDILSIRHADPQSRCT